MQTKARPLPKPAPVPTVVKVKKLPHITKRDLKSVERQLQELQRVLPECKDEEVKVVKKGRIAAPVMSAAKYVIVFIITCILNIRLDEVHP